MVAGGQYYGNGPQPSAKTTHTYFVLLPPRTDRNLGFTAANFHFDVKTAVEQTGSDALCVGRRYCNHNMGEIRARFRSSSFGGFKVLPSLSGPNWTVGFKWRTPRSCWVWVFWGLGFGGRASGGGGVGRSGGRLCKIPLL